MRNMWLFDWLFGHRIRRSFDGHHQDDGRYDAGPVADAYDDMAYDDMDYDEPDFDDDFGDDDF